MAKLVKKKKKKRGLGGFSHSGPAKGEESTLRPQWTPKRPPCANACPNHNKIRKVLAPIMMAEHLEKPYEEAFEEAFYIFAETTPFPSVCGRVCPHPCEGDCNRKDKEGAVGINAIERYIGDRALEKGWKFKKLTDEAKTQKIAVVGAGPAGLACAYHLTRRGFGVTVFEAFPKAGGMLRYGIPDYRLPLDILDAEIQRICDLGVELKLNTMIGKDITYQQLQDDYDMVFIGIGAHKGLNLRVEGEDAENVWTGTGFLHKVNAGETVEIGDKVVVIGGGDTAIDAARIARRLGANATILYRRTRTEMPAIEEEIEGALEEGVDIVYLAAPIEIYRDNGKATGIKCQRMELGEPDDSGRRRPVPIEGDTYDLDVTCLIAAISQEPDFTGCENLIEGRDWIKVDDHYMTKVEQLYSGGDNVNLGLVIDAIYHGRLAAEAINEKVTGENMSAWPPKMKIVTLAEMAHQHYDEMQRNAVTSLPVEERFARIDVEITPTMTEEMAIAESKRCMSCGECFDCGRCWSFCQDNAVIKPLERGGEYKFKMEFCTGCKKCAENCPCGYIEMH
jgi:NADPH-dependent glutamate synthase beta subunit-like oxidoreductase